MAPYGDRAKVVEGTVWPASGHLVLSRGTFGDGREWTTEVRPANLGESASVTAWDLPALCPWDEIDILKTDIEGSEKALFLKILANGSHKCITYE